MQLDAVRTLPNGTVDPDPGVATTISAGLIFATRQRQPNSDVPNTVLVLALEAPAAETVTVDLYVVFEDSPPPQNVGDLPGAVPSARFYLIASGVVVTGSRLLARECFLGGQVYARVTADTLTTSRKLRATCAPGQASESAGGATVVTTTQLPATLGQKNAAGSLSVVLASDDHMKGQAGPVALASAAEAANDLTLARYLLTPPVLTDGQVVTLQVDPNGYLKGREQYTAVAEDNTNGVYAMARLPISAPTYAWSNAFNSAVATNMVAKVTPGLLRYVQGYLDLAIGAGTFYVMCLNEISAVNGVRVLLAPPKKIVVPAVPVDMPFVFDFNAEGVWASTGITIAVSTTGGTTLTLAAAQMIAQAMYK
jgi:hypothetical protein